MSIVTVLFWPKGFVHIPTARVEVKLSTADRDTTGEILVSLQGQGPGAALGESGRAGQSAVENNLAGAADGQGPGPRSHVPIHGKRGQFRGRPGLSGGKRDGAFRVTAAAEFETNTPPLPSVRV